jgi:molecular chaperone GrpE
MSKNTQTANSKQQTDDSVIPEKSGIQSNDLSEANQLIAELTSDLQRIQAEFINYKNRVEAEKATLSQFSKAQVVKDLLPVIDDLERALAHLPEELTEDKWAQGVSKVYDRLQKQLEKLGVTKIDALNKPFDANLHNAVQMDGEGDVQIVSEVMQNGYLLGDQVIRHAAVKVTSQ